MSGEGEAPLLPLSHLIRELADLHLRRHRTLRSAIFARLGDQAEGATITTTVRGAPQPFRVVVAEGELDLRDKLAREGEGGSPVVYVIPFARQLPRDIEASLAGGRLTIPAIESLLPRRFGARSAGPRLLGSRLRLVAQADGARTYASGEAASVDLDEAWLLLLRDRLSHKAAIETEAQLFAAVLLDRDQRAPELATLLDGVSGARDELGEALGLRLGGSAPRIAGAWLDGSAVELLAAALVGEATRVILAEGQGASFTLLTSVLETLVVRTRAHPLRRARDAGVAALAKAVLDLGHLVPLVWPRLDDEALRRAALDEAERILSAGSMRLLALGSNRLPFVFEQRCAAFLGAVEAVAVSASAEAAALSDRTASELLAHEHAAKDERLADQVTMARRLAAFLGEPPLPAALGEPPHVDLIRLATFQMEVGGWVDWARQVTREEASTPLGRGLAPLVARVDAVRDALDARFAQAYAAIVGDRGDRGALRGTAIVDGARGEVLPIEDVLSRMGLGLLEARADLKILILCMDGMSAANLAELWASIARTSFVPVAHGKRAPVVAHVPTLTSLSRSALFAGRTLSRGESLDTGREGERLAKHPVVARLGEAPRVLLKGELVGPGGGLSDDARKAVLEGPRVVAAVVNAIDDQLKGSVQLRVELSTQHVKPLRGLLEAAELTGRLLLLVSDHGHVRAHRFFGVAARVGPLGAPERGARYRTLGPKEVAEADEIVLPAGALSSASGEQRVAAAVHESVRYTALMHHVGEHGGASLAEVIAPAVLLAPRGRLAELGPLDVNEIALGPPSFWERAPRPDPVASPAPERRAQTPPPPKATQVALPFAGAAPSSSLSGEVLRSKLWRQQIETIAPAHHEIVKQAIELLIHHGGRLSRDAFAVALKIDTAGKGVRVRGFLDRLERLANVDQEEVVAMDAQGQVVTLNVPLLRSIFLEDAHE